MKLDDLFQGDDNYPVEEEWQRKVKLYNQIISYFDRGKVMINKIHILNPYNNTTIL